MVFEFLLPTLWLLRRVAGDLCQASLMKSYGLGLLLGPDYDKHKKENMILCPQVSDSCCSSMEQMQIYNQWQSAQKEELITDFVNQMQQAVGDLLDSFVKVDGFAQFTIQQQL